MAQKTKKSLFLMGILSVLLLTVVGGTYRSTSLVIDKIISDHQLSLANGRVEATEIWLDQQMRILSATADSINYSQIGENEETLKPLRLAMKAGHFSDVYIGLPDGGIVDGAGWIAPEGYDVRVRPWYMEAKNAGKTSFTTPYIDLVTMELVIALVRPLAHNGEFVGVIAADTILDSLVKTLLDTKVGETGFLFVTHKNGTILIHPQQEYVMKETLQSIEPTLGDIVSSFNKNRSGTIEYLSGGHDNLLSYKQISNTDWFLCTTIPVKEAYSSLRTTTLIFVAEILLKVLGVLALLTLLGVGGSAVVLFRSSKRYQSTIQKHVDQISGISEDLQWNINKRHEVEARYQTLFNVANDAILVSKGMNIVECNDKASNLFGGDRYSLIGRNEVDIFPDIQPGGRNSEKEARNIIEQAAKGQQQYYEWTFRRLDGREFPAEVSLKSLYLNSEEYVLTSIRDISKRVFAERQMLQNQKMAAMGEMLGAIAHQWRQPLNILSTYIASIQAAHVNRSIDNEFVGTLVTNANTQIQFMSKTIDDFRNFFKPSKRKKSFDIDKSLSRAIKLITPQFSQTGHDIIIHIKPQKTNLMTYGFHSEFVHVLMNIITNAKEAIEERLSSDKQLTKGEINIEISCENKEIVMSIEDNGCGISQNNLTKIFSPYYTSKGTQSGTGLGLYMSKIIIENEMKGKILVESSNAGTRFEIRLPLMRGNGNEHA